MSQHQVIIILTFVLSFPCFSLCGCIPNSIKCGFRKLSSKNETNCMSRRAILSLLKEGSQEKINVSGSQFTSLQEPLLVKSTGEVTSEACKTWAHHTTGAWQDVCKLAHCRDRSEKGCSRISASASFEDSLV